MSENRPIDFSEAEAAYRKLLFSQQTLLLATCAADLKPEISYAPFVRNGEGRYYIFISQLAKHCKNLLQNPQASLLFIEPEAGCANLFARPRVTLRCTARLVASDEPCYADALDALQGKFGQTVALLRSLPDFHLFALKPENGNYVAGFGKAYNIDLKTDTLHPFGG